MLAKSLDPVRTDARWRVLPDKSLRDAADHYDLLFIGGGGGTTGLMENPEMLDFLRAKGANRAVYDLDLYPARWCWALQEFSLDIRPQRTGQRRACCLCSARSRQNSAW